MEKASETDIAHHQQHQIRGLNPHLPPETASDKGDESWRPPLSGGRIPPENDPCAVLTPNAEPRLDHRRENDNSTTTPEKIGRNAPVGGIHHIFESAG
jgi:hypothetical protein